MKQLETLLKGKGPDGRYALIADGVDGYQPWKSLDTYVIQASHATAKHIYTDILHIAAEAGKDYKSIVHAFSHSQDVIDKNFAYGDRGQNYKVTENDVCPLCPRVSPNAPPLVACYFFF